MNIAIIQARMGSSRLPNKMMLHMHGHPIIEWVHNRVKKSSMISQVVFVIPDTSQNDILELYLKSIGANIYRGSEVDLVDRFYETSKEYRASNVIRICADNPLVCSSEIDRLVGFYSDNICDYAYNHIPKGNRYPDGLGAEICSFDLLQEIYNKATIPEHREHVFNYIWDNLSQYQIKTFDPPPELAHPHLKLDLDTIQDYIGLINKPYNIAMSANEVVNTALKG